MISRKLFVDTLEGIKKEFEIRDKAEKELRELGLSIDYERTLFLESMLKLLKETVPDPYEYISWWLYDASDYKVSWEEDGKKIEVDLKEATDLYDFLVAEADKETDIEKFLSDAPASECDIAPRKAMEQTDFVNYMNAVLRYLDTHDIVIEIVREGVCQHVVMSMKLYEQLFGPLKVDESVDEDGMIPVEIQIDPELERQARQALEGTNFTLEQVCEMFFAWCAHYPKDAKAWLKKSMAEEEAQRERPEKAEEPQ